MHRDLYAEVTNRIVAALEAGVTPWIRPWTVDFDPVPINAVSRRTYRGINAMLLTLEAQTCGYRRNAWLTYRQAKELGAQVRAGESGTTVVFYKLHELPHLATVEQIEDGKKPRIISFLRWFTVFNVSQVEGLPERLKEKEAMVAWDALEAAETILRESRARFEYGGVDAYYSPADDRIQLPARACFADAAAFYNVALHELVHWSGHPGRLSRNLEHRFGEAAYAMEELVAEVGSAFLGASCYLEARLRHASYIGSWLEVLKGDKRAVFAAAAKAQQAVDFIESVCGTPPIAVTSNAAWRHQEAGTV